MKIVPNYSQIWCIHHFGAHREEGHFYISPVCAWYLPLVEVPVNSGTCCSLFTEKTQVYFDTAISYECEKAHILLLCEIIRTVWMCEYVSITSFEISLKQTCGVSSVELCCLLITHTKSRCSLQITRIGSGQARTLWTRKANNVDKWLMKPGEMRRDERCKLKVTEKQKNKFQSSLTYELK